MLNPQVTGTRDRDNGSITVSRTGQLMAVLSEVRAAATETGKVFSFTVMKKKKSITAD